MSASAEAAAAEAFVASLRVHALRVSTARGQLATLQPDLLVLVGTLLASLDDFLRLTCTCTAIRDSLAPHRRLVIARFATALEPHSSPEMNHVRRMLGIPPFVSFEEPVTADDLLRLSRLFADTRISLLDTLRCTARVMLRCLMDLITRVQELTRLVHSTQYADVEPDGIAELHHYVQKSRHVMMLQHAKMCSMLLEHRFRFKTTLRTLGTVHNRDSQVRWRALLKSILHSRHP